MTVVVRSNEGLNDAVRGSGLGPCTEAVILREEVGGTKVLVFGVDEEGISR